VPVLRYGVLPSVLLVPFVLFLPSHGSLEVSIPIRTRTRPMNHITLQRAHLGAAPMQFSDSLAPRSGERVRVRGSFHPMGAVSRCARSNCPGEFPLTTLRSSTILAPWIRTGQRRAKREKVNRARARVGADSPPRSTCAISPVPSAHPTQPQPGHSPHPANFACPAHSTRSSQTQSNPVKPSQTIKSGLTANSPIHPPFRTMHSKLPPFPFLLVTETFVPVKYRLSTG
jgi:hypothetical protein